MSKFGYGYYSVRGTEPSKHGDSIFIDSEGQVSPRRNGVVLHTYRNIAEYMEAWEFTEDNLTPTEAPSRHGHLRSTR